MIKQINEAKRVSAAQWSDRMKRRKGTKKRIFENRSESEESNSSYDDESKNENSEFSCDDNRIPKQCANCFSFMKCFMCCTDTFNNSLTS